MDDEEPFPTGERGPAVGAARGGGVRLVLRQLSDGEGGLAGVAEPRRLVPLALGRDGKLRQQTGARALIYAVGVCRVGQGGPGSKRRQILMRRSEFVSKLRGAK